MQKLLISGQAPVSTDESSQSGLRDSWGIHVSMDHDSVVEIMEQFRPGEASKDNTLFKQIVYHLRVLGIHVRLSGHKGIYACVCVYREDPTRHFQKEIYPLAAQICGASSAASVERSIRTAIHDAWKKRNNEVWAQYFPVNADGEVECPTNKDFILTLAMII